MGSDGMSESMSSEAMPCCSWRCQAEPHLQDLVQHHLV